MKQLNYVPFPKINTDDSYTVVIEPYMDRVGPQVFLAKGSEVIERIKKTFMFDPTEGDNLPDFLVHAEASNGDGNDLIEVYKE